MPCHAHAALDTTCSGSRFCLTALGAAYGTAKSVEGIAKTALLHPQFIVKSLIPVIMVSGYKKKNTTVYLSQKLLCVLFSVVVGLSGTLPMHASYAL